MVMKMSGLVYNIMLAAAISYYFTWASIKPGARYIPEHAGTCRNIPEHEKIKIIVMKKIIIK